jgi:predicted nucleic acid-binding protein
MERDLLVVADTSPLNYLVRLGYSELLPDLYGRVLIPPAVLRELTHTSTPAEVRSWIAYPPSWLEVTAPALIDPTLPPKLGLGEREAISLALERRADAILIDDALGRSEAKARALPVNGTLFVILESALRGRVNFEDGIRQLRQIGFRFSLAVEEDMRRRFLKRKSQ